MPLVKIVVLELTVEEAEFLHTAVKAAAEVHVGSELEDLAVRVAEQVTAAVATSAPEVRP